MRVSVFKFETSGVQIFCFRVHGFRFWGSGFQVLGFGVKLVCFRVSAKTWATIWWIEVAIFSSVCCKAPSQRTQREIGILLPNNQRQHRTLHIQKDVQRIVLVTVPRVSRSCEHFPDGFDHHLLPTRGLKTSTCEDKSLES